MRGGMTRVGPCHCRLSLQQVVENSDLPRHQKNPDRLCMRNTLRVLDFFASLHLTIFERLYILIFLKLS
jgi:hypothetical protein